MPTPATLPVSFWTGRGWVPVDAADPRAPLPRCYRKGRQERLAPTAAAALEMYRSDMVALGVPPETAWQWAGQPGDWRAVG